MTTQLTQQDPLSPMDNTQMVAQMAQFSQVAGLSEIKNSLADLAATMKTGRLNDASGWIGRTMLVDSAIVSPLNDGSYAGEVRLDGDAQDFTVNFMDSNGAVVGSQALGAQKAGSLTFQWDGKTTSGDQATGPLKVMVAAHGADGNVTSTVSSWTQIRGIQSPASSGASQLVTGLGLLSPEDAIRLS
jgi:flagellar basal-body rod modification protein FlgD